MVKTIELMLGLPALSMFDLVASDMRASFIAPGEKPDLTPYDALVPAQSLYDLNVRVGSGGRLSFASDGRRPKLCGPGACLHAPLGLRCVAGNGGASSEVRSGG